MKHRAFPVATLWLVFLCHLLAGRMFPNRQEIRESKGKYCAATSVGNENDPVDCILGPGDLILLSGSSIESSSHLIGANGAIAVALIGTIAAAGLTPAQLTAQLEDRFRRYLKHPDLQVRGAGKEYLPREKYFVDGRVLHPGVYLIDRPVNVLQAIRKAGNAIAPIPRNIYLVHGDTRLAIRYADLSKGALDHVLMQNGDHVVVP